MPIDKRVIYTIQNFRKVAYHHYGRSPFSLFRFIYYSLFRLNAFLVFEKDLRRTLPEVDLDPGNRFILPSLEELERVRQGKDLPREFFSDHIHNAKVCCIGLCGDELAYIHWVYSKGEYSRFVILGQDVCEINHVTTLPRFRGKKISMKALEYASKTLQSMGCKKVVVVVHKNNIAFIKNIKSLDFKETKRIRAIGPFNRKVPVS